MYKELKENQILTAMMVVTMLVIIIAGLKAASELLTPLILALFLATLSASLINYLVKRGVPKFLSWVSVLIFIVGFIVVLGLMVSASANEFASKLPTYMEKLDLIIDQSMLSLGLSTEIDTEHFKNIYHPGYLLNYTVSAASRVGEVLSEGFLIVLTVIFMLIQRHSFVDKVKYLTEDDAAYSHFKKVTKLIDHYFLILTLFSTLTGITVYVALVLLNIDFALMWALAAFFLNFIPNIGSIIAAAPPILIALIEHDPIHAAIVASVYLLINLVYGTMLQPRYIGKGLDLSILVVFLSLVFWGWIFGPVGMFLSVPITIMFKILFESSEKTQWIAVMLGSEPDTALEREIKG